MDMFLTFSFPAKHVHWPVQPIHQEWGWLIAWFSSFSFLREHGFFAELQFWRFQLDVSGIGILIGHSFGRLVRLCGRFLASLGFWRIRIL